MKARAHAAKKAPPKPRGKKEKLSPAVLPSEPA
jgi:hypothetical protein